MNEPALPPQTASPVETESPSLVRRVLFSILAVMIVALIYEYGFVRRSYKAAETAVDDFVDQRGAAVEGQAITPQVVQAAIGKTPTGGLQDKGDYYLEHYKWVRWLPWKSYDIYVIYDHSDPPRLFNTTRPEPPGPGDVPYPELALEPPAIAPGPGPGYPGDSATGPAGRRRPSAEGEDEAASGDFAAEASPDQPTDATPAAEESAKPASPNDADSSAAEDASEAPADDSEPKDDAAPPADDTE
jgi:hypothetical protein